MIDKSVIDMMDSVEAEGEDEEFSKRVWNNMTDTAKRAFGALGDLCDDAGGWDKSLVRAAALALKESNPDLSKKLLEAEEAGRYLIQVFNGTIREEGMYTKDGFIDKSGKPEYNWES